MNPSEIENLFNQYAKYAYESIPGNRYLSLSSFTELLKSLPVCGAREFKKCKCKSNGEQCAYFHDDRDFCWLNEENEPVNYIESPCSLSIDRVNEVIESLEKSDKQLESDNYKEWCYSRLSISEAIKLLKTLI